MKSIFTLILLALLATVTFGQVQPTAEIIKLGATYHVSTIDTTTGWISVGASQQVALVFTSHDSVAVEVAVDSKVYGSSRYTSTDSTTIITATNTGTTSQYILRNRSIEKAAGLVNLIRFRFKFQDSCGTTTPTYDATVYKSWQQTPITFDIFNGKAYANSQLDTSKTLFPTGYSRISAYFNATDSVSLSKLYLDKRTIGVSTWTLQDSLTITSVVGAGWQQEWILRDATTDKITGAGTQIRFRPKFNSSGNGVTTPKYSIQLNLAK